MYFMVFSYEFAPFKILIITFLKNVFMKCIVIIISCC